MIDISIIVVSFNTKDLTIQCIKSIVESKPKLSYEMIVVDNGSHDGTVQEIKKNVPKLIIVENKENLGFAKAVNQGIKIAKGKYVFLLNSDTQVRRGTIEKLIGFAERKSEAGAVVPKLLNPDGSIQGSVFREPTVARVMMQYWFGQKKIVDKYAPSDKGPQEVEFAVMAAFLITPEVLREVGLLDERYFMFYEDHDYCKRIRKFGLKVFYLPGAEVVHDHGGSGKNLADDANQWRRLIPSSIIYHGLIKHYLLNFIIWSGQKWQKLLKID